MDLDLFAEPSPAASPHALQAEALRGLPLYLGTSSWSFEDWRGSVYPVAAKPAEFLSHYARRFPVVEIDTTFYRIPTAAAVEAWYRRTPAGFRFAAKIPRLITHDKRLHDCQAELRQFTEVMGLLGEKLGPLLFQFPYFAKRHFATPQAFVDRLARVLEGLPAGMRFAVEIRNRWWVHRRLLDLLRAHGVAFALVDHPWMPPIGELVRQHDVITADFTYIRWLGDRQAMEAVTRRWDRLVVDRRRDTALWVGVIRQFLARQIAVYGFYNNHYAGHSPGSIALFYELWSRLPPLSPATQPSAGRPDR
jgi:uncharacterized protein YecE (DUF72 family)